jgi:ubiquitin C-terminal hydrolase
MLPLSLKHTVFVKCDRNLTPLKITDKNRAHLIHNDLRLLCFALLRFDFFFSNLNFQKLSDLTALYTAVSALASHAHIASHNPTLLLLHSSVPIGKRGRVGLFNLGNSCYMSSSLQCLSHVYPLTTYFLSGRYVGDINEVSKDSTGGRLVRSACRLHLHLFTVSPLLTF